MNTLILSALACLLVAAQPETKTWVWFQKNANVAVDHARNHNAAKAMSVIDELRQEAQRQKNPEKTLYVQWKKGHCEYYLGNLSESIKTLKAITDEKDNTAFRHLIYRDLGDAYLDSGNLTAAQTQLKNALDQDARVKTDNAFDEAEQISIQLKQVAALVGLREMSAAKKALMPLAKTITARVGASKDPVVWACLDARWQMLHAGIDLDARNVVGALVRLDKAQKNLQPFAKSKEAVDLRFKSQVGLASDYWLLARFADADTQLDNAGKLVNAVATERNKASIENARAALLIERTSLAIEEDPSAARILDDLKDAEARLTKAMQHHDAADKARDSFTATVDFQLAQVHELRGRALEFAKKKAESVAEFQKGKERCDQALAWYDKVLPPENDLVLEVHNRRAWLSYRLGDAKSAEREGRDALERFDKTHKASDLDRGRYLHVLMEAENRLGNANAAAKYAERHRKQVDEGLGAILAGLSAAEQSQFFRKWDTPAMNASLRLGVEHPGDQGIASASVEWLINGKAKLEEVLATQVATARRGDKLAFAKYQKSVQRQAYLLYGEPTTNAERDFLFEESIKRDIAEAAAQGQAPQQPHWYTLREIRAGLTEDEVYVGLYALRPEDDAERAYYAWIVAQNGPVKMLKLGPARDIDALVKVFLREQESVPLITPGEEKRAEKILQDLCLKQLSTLVLEPIRAQVGGKKRWVISPDGPLWTIPWAALLLPDDRYAIDELTIRYAVSGRDLVRPASLAARAGAPLIVGDPWFNYPSADPRRLRKPGLDPLRIPTDRMEYSEKECEAMNTIMQAYQLKPTRLQGAMQKERLLSLGSPPRMMYLATHGYASLPSRLEVDDPLLSCAIAFAGWNYLPETRDSLPGMMTGSEVLTMDLHGTELVVLASCQTEIAALAPGQSPANLRHAFHLAGAQAVVSALWTVSDKSSMDLMEPFVETVCQGGADKIGALRLAQQQSIRYLRMYRDHSHPYYWAGLTISGS